MRPIASIEDFVFFASAINLSDIATKLSTNSASMWIRADNAEAAAEADEAVADFDSDTFDCFDCFDTCESFDCFDEFRRFVTDILFLKQLLC